MYSADAVVRRAVGAFAAGVAAAYGVAYSTCSGSRLVLYQELPEGYLRSDHVGSHGALCPITLRIV